MSGVEVVGVVLGAIPLVISGLEHYANGARAIKSFRDYPREFASLARRLRIQELIFVNTVEKILLDCVEDFLVRELLAAPNGNSWSKPYVKRALQARLGSSYGLYIDTIESMQKSVPFTKDPSSFKEAYFRLKFSLKRSNYADLVNDLCKDNAALDRLTEQEQILRPLRASRASVDFDRFRSRVTSAFDSLQRGMHRSCKSLHTAYLHVDAVEAAQKLEDSRDSDLAMRALICHRTATTPVPTGTACEETEMRLLTPRSLGALQTTAQAMSMTTASTALQAATMGSPSLSILDVAEITDICESMENSRTMGCGAFLGFFQDSARGFYHGVFSPTNPILEAKEIANPFSLADVFSGKLSGRELSVGECRQLAAHLASSMLCLYDTPWLAKQWGCKEVVLFQGSRELIVASPFISTKVNSSRPLTLVTNPPDQYFTPCDGIQIETVFDSPDQYFTPCDSIQNETVLALGIVLIELCLQRPFKSLMSPAELNADGTKHARSDFYTAMRAWNEVDATAGRNYGDAVRRCVQGCFGISDAKLENNDFRRSIFDGVVAVLQRDVDTFFGRTG